MIRKINIEEKEFQAAGYATVAILVAPDPKTYYQGVTCSTDTDDTTSDVILNDILKKYRGTWERLAEL